MTLRSRAPVNSEEEYRAPGTDTISPIETAMVLNIDETKNSIDVPEVLGAGVDIKTQVDVAVKKHSEATQTLVTTEKYLALAEESLVSILSNVAEADAAVRTRKAALAAVEKELQELESRTYPHETDLESKKMQKAECQKNLEEARKEVTAWYDRLQCGQQFVINSRIERDKHQRNVEQLKAALDQLLLDVDKCTYSSTFSLWKLATGILFHLISISLSCFQGSIFTHGFPHPVAAAQSTATSSGNPRSSHLGARLVLKPFKGDDEIVIGPHSDLWSWKFYKLTSSFSCENSLAADFIRPALREILSSVTQLKDMHIESSVELQLLDGNANSTRCKSDFWVVRNLRTDKVHPFCAIEAKLPQKDPANYYTGTEDLKESVAGQMFNYLCLLRQHFGIRAPFGIVTTYFTWWICWLPDCDRVAMTSEVNDSVTSTEMPPQRLLHAMKLYLPPFFERAQATRQNLESVKTFSHMLASAVWKSVKCGHCELSTALSTYSVCYNKDSVAWEGLKLEAGIQITDAMPKPEVNKLYVLGYLGAGADGKARLVCDSDGHRCVMKHYHHETVAQQMMQAKREQEMWKLVNGIDVYVRTLNKRPALIMPYLPPLSTAERNDPAIQDQIIDLLESCADRNSLQRDADWRHVGWYKNVSAGTSKLMLFDFGRLHQLDEIIDTVERQERINAAVSEFCTCRDRSCLFCIYVKHHSERS